MEARSDSPQSDEETLILHEQLRKARETIAASASDVARHMEVKEELVRDWETGKAQPRLRELERLAEIYGRDIDYFLKKTPEPPKDLGFRSPSARQFITLSEEARLTIAKFDELCRTAFELEQSLGKERSPDIQEVSSRISPSELARRERNRLGLGTKPAKNLRQLLARRGIRIFELIVPNDEFSGFSNRHPIYGPCIMISARELVGRRNFTLAHEYCHLLYRHPPSVCDIAEVPAQASRGLERQANMFAVEFLLPSQPLRDDCSRRELPTMPSAEQVGTLKGKWGVSVQAMLYRLEGLELVPSGYSEELLRSLEDSRPFRRRPKVPAWRRRLGEPFVSTALEAYRQGHISLGKLSRSLGLPIRKALAEAESQPRTG